MKKTIRNKYPNLHAGLNQIPTRNLRSLLKQLEDLTTPLIFTGYVKDHDGY